MRTSKHAQIRMQQRGIPEQLIKNIIVYGSTRRVAGRAVARFMSKSDLKGLSHLLPKNECIQLDRQKNVYAVMNSQQVIPIGHRTRRFYN